MKSGGPWNSRGLRPDAREAAREAARPSGPSVSEWLNRVVESDADRQDSYDDDRRPRRPRSAERHRRDWTDDEAAPFRPDGGPYRNEYRGRGGRQPNRDHDRSSRDDRPRRGWERDYEHVVARARDEIRDTARAEAHRELARAREDIGEVHARLDRLSRQLERLAHDVPAKGSPAARRTMPQAEPGGRQVPPLTGAPPQRPRAPREQALSIEDAVAEIAARQRELDSEPAARTGAPERQPAAPVAPGPSLDFSALESQLRQITNRIDALKPANDLEKAIAAVRTDLTEIGRQLTEALPRRAVESLEIEVKALSERIDHSRQSGVDANALTGLEHGLAEIREALRGLTPAENLVGFEEAVQALAQKVDMIVAREDPSALQQLEAAIGGLRGVVSHVASNDTLTRVAEDVRALATQVDTIANNAASGHAVSALEQRIDSLAAALSASSEAGHAVPRDLEKLLAGLIEKLEWVQLTHTDHAALAHLEDRIAMLVQRFDASDARLGHLEAIERGLADLLVHIEQMRGGNAAAARLAPPAQANERDIERDVAEIRQSERHTQDSLEAVQDTVEHVVDRLATIESDLHREAPARAGPAPPQQQIEMPEEPAAPEPEVAQERPPATAAAGAAAAAAVQSRMPSRVATPRPPIDPNLPPDHPLEPGSALGRSRPAPSAADRVAASEAAIGSTKPPVIADSGRPDFIAAARRAAQAAAWEPAGHKPNGDAEPDGDDKPSKSLTQRLRKLIVAGGALLILIGCLRIATRLFDYGDSGAASQAHTERTVPPANAQAAAPAKPSLPERPPVSLNPAFAVPPTEAPAATKAEKPGRQSMLQKDARGPKVIAVPPQAGEDDAGAAAVDGDTAMQPWATPDITGALSPPAAPQDSARKAGVIEDKLPATIGPPALRAAAMAGDAAAAYVVATRFADGRGVTENDEEAARWFERAAKQGLTPAQFRLGGLYEKGIGVKKNLATARDLYRAAGGKGNGKAMHNLAVLYAEGIDGPPDYRNAVLWFRKAADHGVEDSQYNLGILYARGIGVGLNYAEAYKWFALAAKQGDRDAAKKAEEVAAHLDKDALAAARLAVQTWSPEPQPQDAISVKTAAAWDAPAKGRGQEKSKPRLPGLNAAESGINSE